MDIYYKMAGPFLRTLKGNWSHDLSVWALKSGLLRAYGQSFDERLKVTLKGRIFKHPIGLAAGFDKNAQAISHLYRMGIGHMELGAVTPKAQPGNERPTLFRNFKDQAVINRMGFNNHGLDVFLKNIESYDHGLPYGVNLGKNKHSEDGVYDYALLAQALADKADWLTINVSSPNTPGLREYQQIDHLRNIIQAVKKPCLHLENPPLIFVKIAPDLNENDLVDMADLLKSEHIDAVITTNTTIQRPQGLNKAFASQTGGLSGRPLKSYSFHVQKIMAQMLHKSDVAIIASGGIENIDDAWQRIIYGASLLQIYSAMIWKGPHLAGEMAHQLVEKMEQEGFQNLSEAIGSAL